VIGGPALHCFCCLDLIQVTLMRAMLMLMKLVRDWMLVKWGTRLKHQPQRIVKENVVARTQRAIVVEKLYRWKPLALVKAVVWTLYPWLVVVTIVYSQG
jgi:hypothetical protein